MTYANSRDLSARKPVRYWHEAIINDIIAFPLSSNVERAKRLGYSAPYLSTITNSDMFKAILARRQEDFSQRLQQSLAHKTAKVAGQMLDIMSETLDKKRDQIPFAVLADTTDKTLQRLGYGVVPKGAGANVQVNVNTAPSVTVTPEQLAEARAALRASEQNRAQEPTMPRLPAGGGPVIEHEPAKVPGEPSETKAESDAPRLAPNG